MYSANARLPVRGSGGRMTRCVSSFYHTQNCIVPGIGEENVSIYNSLVHYHQASPVFNETIQGTVVVGSH